MTPTLAASKVVEIRAQKALQASPIQSLNRLKVNEHDSALVISGTVSSYYHKQLAQEVVRCVAQDLELVNAITVV